MSVATRGAVLLGNFGRAEQDRQNRLVVAGAHLDLADRAVDLQALDRVDELFLVDLARLAEALGDEVRRDVGVERREARGHVVARLELLHELLVGAQLGVVEEVVHGAHDPFRGVGPERLEHGVVDRGVDVDRDLLVDAGRLDGLQHVGHARAARAEVDQVGFGGLNAGEVGHQVGLAQLPPGSAEEFDVRLELRHVAGEAVVQGVAVLVVVARHPDALVALLGQHVGGRLAGHGRVLGDREHVAVAGLARDVLALAHPGEERDLLLLGHRVRNGERDAAVHDADEHVHVLLEHQLLGHVEADVHLELVVAGDELDLAAENPLLVDLLQRQLEAVQGVVAEDGRGAAVAVEDADLDVAGIGCRRQEQRRYDQEQTQGCQTTHLHRHPPFRTVDRIGYGVVGKRARSLNLLRFLNKEGKPSQDI